ncbi:MAG: hypothetical protein P9X22_03085 [Candidatus Zapsychrus exili]|nr:hypothetical protein [Candidatus Zapsychrus exili]
MYGTILVTFIILIIIGLAYVIANMLVYSLRMTIDNEIRLQIIKYIAFVILVFLFVLIWYIYLLRVG